MNSTESVYNSVSLFIITDPSNDQNCDYCTYLINILNKKLNTISLKLNQIFLINDKKQLMNHLRLLDYQRNDWILITSTSDENDQLMYTMVEENNNNLNNEKIDFFNNPVPFYNKRIFVLNKKCFNSSLATCMKYLNQSNRIATKKLSFNNEETFKQFLNAFNELFHLNISRGVAFKNEQLELKPWFNNYSKYAFKLTFFDQTMSGVYERSLIQATYCSNNLLEDNFVNADFYVYSLAESAKYLCSDFDDIVYLRGKIDEQVFSRKLQETIKVIEQSFRDYKPEEICVSFNGGKDCCVVLYLAFAVALRMGIKFPLNAVLIQIKNQFKEMDDYVQSLTKSKYTQRIIDFIYFNDLKPMKESLVELQEIRPSIKAILIGTRRSDGVYFKNLQPFAYTDGDWPKYMRINPILDWTFSEIWYFLRILKLPYCSLYDSGYTSIDNTLNTVPNINLLAENGADYLPAWKLRDQDSERDSRKKK